jgi:hypothetical protein
MNVWMYIILLMLIISLWVLVERYEWKLPSCWAGKIGVLGGRQEKEVARQAFIINFEAREFASEDIEKEVYIIRKSRSENGQCIIMNVGVKAPEPIFSEEEREKAKLRLERRFPGLTVNFTQEEKEKKDVVLCSD